MCQGFIKYAKATIRLKPPLLIKSDLQINGWKKHLFIIDMVTLQIVDHKVPVVSGHNDSNWIRDVVTSFNLRLKHMSYVWGW